MCFDTTLELGGTVGDIESAPFIEAMRQFQFRMGRENFALIHVSLVPDIHGEQKTKPTQVCKQLISTAGLDIKILCVGYRPRSARFGTERRYSGLTSMPHCGMCSFARSRLPVGLSHHGHWMPKQSRKYPCFVMSMSNRHAATNILLYTHITDGFNR